MTLTGTFTSKEKQITATITWEIKDREVVFTAYSIGGRDCDPKYPNQNSKSPNGIEISGVTSGEHLSFATAELKEKKESLSQPPGSPIFSCHRGMSEDDNRIGWLGKDGNFHSEDKCTYSLS